MADEERQSTASTGHQLGAQPVIDDCSMDDLIEKLKLVDYETAFCKANGNSFKLLNRIYFAAPADNANLQFFYFTSLCSFLMTTAGNNNFPPPGQFDDPNAVSTNILNELRGMSLNVRDIAPNRMRQGHGDAVLTILHMLADKALMAKNFSFGRPIQYPAAATDLEEHVGDADAPAADNGDTIDDNIAFDSDSDDEMFSGMGKGKAANAEKEAIEPQVSAEDWHLEVERVAPLLQYRSDDVRDWRSRVDNAQTLMKAVDKMYPDVKSMLERMGDDLGKTLDRIHKREQTLGQQFLEQVEEYRTQLRELNTVQDSFNVSSKTVSQLSIELNSITEALEQVKTDIQDREEKSSDITPLMKIKEAVAKIKSEIKEMSLRIGVLQHTVLHYTLRQQKARRTTSSSGQGQLPMLGGDDSLMEPDFGGYM